jgi:hypothetical protein
MSTSLRLMLLGIALLLFSLATPQLTSEFFAFVIMPLHPYSRLVPDLIVSIIPVAGIVLVFIGFFKRDR